MSYYTTNIQLGSEGDDVKRWQEYLKNNGHSMLNVNGTFDDDTLIATQEFQSLNGLGESGVVDDSTWRKAGFTKNTPNYDTTKYEDTKEGGAAAQAHKDALGAVSGYDSFNYGKQTELDNIMQSILERKPFTYNFNEDAFYQMYKDKYQKQGKMAAANVTGQAAALTGGYGNSYAATAGNQAYLGYLENLNDIIPELYQMAYNKYSQEGQDMYNQYGLLSDDYNRQKAADTDKYNRLVDAANAARSDYYSGAESFYDAQDRANKAMYDEYDMATAQNKALTDYNKWYAEFVAKNGFTPESLYQPVDPVMEETVDPVIEETTEPPKSSTNLMDFNRDQYYKNVEANGGSYYGTALNDLKELKENGASNKTAQTYLAELVANSLLTGSEYSNLYNKYRDNKLK